MMQLVIMAAMLALTEAGGCSFGCHPTNISIDVESCGTIEPVYTTICAGHCYHRDWVYIGADDWGEQKICNGDWSYEVKYIKGCPEAVTYPVARNCMCSRCDPGSTDCGRFPRNIPSCLSSVHSAALSGVASPLMSASADI
ncbi:gonadotropin subunit beta-1-like [Genypterus blacodes]|uniref:gonadotropin subunit beta-1-like n=1 Tax=Genypterus blacodes TaxID=154954 RepID=UPI003F7724D5